MKIHISVGRDFTKPGYLNIDPITGQNNEVSVKADIRNLDELVADAECVELVAENVLDYLEASEADQALRNWVKKLRRGGKIIIGGIDAHQISKMFYYKEISIEKFNLLTHGQFSKSWDVLMSHTTIEDLQQKLKDCGIKILKKRIDGFNLVIEGERP